MGPLASIQEIDAAYPSIAYVPAMNGVICAYATVSFVGVTRTHITSIELALF
jgi:hypothetical protein